MKTDLKPVVKGRGFAVRVSQATHAAIAEIAKTKKIAGGVIVAEAMELYLTANPDLAAIAEDQAPEAA